MAGRGGRDDLWVCQKYVEDPLVLDSGMVDPDDFTAALLRIRPDLAPVLGR